jgi:hypothetical protein
METETQSGSLLVAIKATTVRQFNLSQVYYKRFFSILVAKNINKKLRSNDLKKSCFFNLCFPPHLNPLPGGERVRVRGTWLSQN